MKDLNQNEKPAVNQLEKKLRRYLPLKHFLFTAFSRNALFLIIRAFNWEQPAEIIIPAFTCPVIKFTIEASGIRAVPVDAEKDGLNIDPELIEQAINSNTKAVYVVHTYGNPAQIQKICAIARAHDLIVIEDLAHSLFTSTNGKLLGTYGDFAILSFTKQTIDFEGGAVATNHTEIYRRMLQLRDEYQQQGSVSFSGLVDSYVRIVGSWWESGFSLLALGFMKMHDRLNSLIYKGSYGISIDFSKFYMSSLGAWLANIQLAGLYKKKKAPGFLNRDTSQDCQMSQSPYHLGMPVAGELIDRILSFRTWHNANQPGQYPRADHLHETLRIYSKTKSAFGKRSLTLPDNSILES